MTCISITEFGGLNTDKSARNKQRVFAQVAHNCLLTDGSLRPMPAWTLFSTLPANKCTENNFIYEDSRDGRILAAVDYKDAVYLTGKPFALDLLVGIDITEHETLFGMPTNLRAAENADSINGDRPLGLPTPNFNVHFSGSNVGYSAQLLSLKPVNRILGVSFCRQTASGFEESTIAVIPEQTPYGIMFEGDIVSVSLSLNMGEINDAKVTHIRLYRTISGLDTGEQVTNELDTDWFLLDTIAVTATINYNDGGAVTTDPMDLYLAKHFYPPSFNAGHFGLTESGWFYMVACDGRGAVSERFLHHAWPTENKFYIPENAVDVVTNYDTIYIGTNARPYFVAVGPGEGEQGVQISAVPFQERLLCLPRTMVVAPGGAIYASHHGLVSLSKSGQKLITSGLTNPGDTLYDNGTIKANIGETKLGAFWNGSYFGFCADVSPDVCNIEEPPPETVLLLVVGDNKLAASSTTGKVWTEVIINAGPPSTDWSGVAYGNGKWVVVGEQTIVTSLDLANWALATHPNVGFVFTFVLFNEDLGVFVAGAGGGGTADGALYQSIDGDTWEEVTTLTSGFQSLQCGIYREGRYIFGCGPSQGWAIVTDDLINITYPLNGTSHNGVCWGNNEYMFVGATNGAGAETWTTPDGLIDYAFLGAEGGITYGFHGVLWDEIAGLYTAACSGNPGFSGVYTSPDGDTWAQYPAFSNNFCYAALRYSPLNLNFITASGSVLLSEDNATYTEYTLDNFVGQACKAIAAKRTTGE